MPKQRPARHVLLATVVIAVWVGVAAAGPALLVDHGGRVLGNPQVSAIYLGDYWTARQGASDLLHTDAFLQAWIAGPSVTGVLAQYGVSAGSFVSSVTVAGAAPLEFTDAAAQALVQQQLAARRVVGGDETVHVVYLPPGTVLMFQGNRSQRKLGGYHSSYRDAVTGNPVYYAVVVYNEGTNGLDFNGNPQDNLSIMTSRVLAGALTNPDVGDVLRGASPQSVVAWRDDVNGEVGDIAFTLSKDAALGDVWVLQNGFAAVLLWSNEDDKLAASTPTVTVGATATGAATVSISPATQEAVPGTSVTYTVANAATSVGTLTLSLSTLPANVTGTFASTTLAPGASTTLTITVAAAAATGTTTFTVTGTTAATATAAATTETATATLAVVTTLTPAAAATPAANFSLSVTPTTQEVIRGGDVVTFVITTTGDANTTVKLKTQHVRSGIKADLSRTRVAAGETVILTIRAHRDARRRAYELTLKGSSNQTDQRITLTIVVK